MSKTRILAVGVFTLTAIFLLNLSAQVVVQSSLFEEKNIMPGNQYEIKISIYNPSEFPIEILIIKKDYLFRNNKHNFFDPGKMERSNSDWINVEHTRMLLLAKEKTVLIFPVLIPENAIVGTHHSILGIQTKAGNIKKEAVNVALNTQHNIQIVSNVNKKEAKRKLEITKTEIKDDKLRLTIRNTGELILTFKIIPPIPNIQSNRRARIYPNMSQTVELDVLDLSDGAYKNLRFLLDNGTDFIQPVFINFIKGELPEQAELYVLDGERLREKRKRRSTYRPSVFAVLSYGSNFKSISLSGSMNLFGNLISLRGGSNYREYENFIISNEILTHRVGTSLNLKNFRATYSAYFFEAGVFEMIGANYHLKNLNINCNYTPNRKLLQGNIRHQFWRRWSISFSGIYDFKLEKKRYSVSLMIPIL